MLLIGIEDEEIVSVEWRIISASLDDSVYFLLCVFGGAKLNVRKQGCRDDARM